MCREVRRAGVETPIVLLTARAQEAEKVMGLEAGADDYVTKPYSARELRARIKAHLRRSCAARRRRSTASATPSWTSAAASCGAAEKWSICRRWSSSCFPPSSNARGACSRAPSCSTRYGDRHARHRPRGGQPGDQPAQEDRARTGAAAVSGCAARPGLPIRWRRRDRAVTLERLAADTWFVACSQGGSRT